ncbi:MAG: HEAT repeat domain-containing protein [Planctomycetota bacterium]
MRKERRGLCIVWALALVVSGCTIRVRRFEGEQPPMDTAAVDAAAGRVLASAKGEAAGGVRGVMGGEALRKGRAEEIRKLALDRGPFSKKGIGRLLDAGVAPLAEEVLDVLVTERAKGCAREVLDRLGKPEPAETPRWVQAAYALDPEATRGKLAEFIVDASVDGKKRLAAVRTAAEFKASDAVEVLVAGLARGEGAVQDEIFAKLETVTGAGIGKDLAGWQRWWQANREKPPQQWLAGRVTELRAQLDSDRERSAKALAELVEIAREGLKDAQGERGEKLVTAALRAGVPEIRAAAAVAAGRMRLAALSGELEGLIADPDAEVRLSAVRALGEIGAGAARGKIGTALRTDSDARVRAAAAEALGKSADKQAIASLLQALRDGDSGVRDRAVDALVALSASEAAPAMVDMLGKEDCRENRETLARALGELGDPSAAQELGKLLVGGERDENVRVRWVAADSLGKLKDPGSARVLEAALGDSDGRVREAALIALERLGTPEALEALYRKTSDTDPKLAASAWKALQSAALPDAAVSVAWVKRLIEAGETQKAKEFAASLSQTLVAAAGAPYEVLRDLAEAQVSLGMHAEARSAGAAALAKRKDEARTWKAYLGALTALGEFKEAWGEYGEYAKAVEGADEDALAGKVVLIEVALRAGRRDEALAFWKDLDEKEGTRLSAETRKRVLEAIAPPSKEKLPVGSTPQDGRQGEPATQPK